MIKYLIKTNQINQLSAYKDFNLSIDEQIELIKVSGYSKFFQNNLIENCSRLTIGQSAICADIYQNPVFMEKLKNPQGDLKDLNEILYFLKYFYT